MRVLPRSGPPVPPLLAAALLLPALAAAQPQPVRTTARDRVSASVTIYNRNLGLVREVREFDVPSGAVELAFEDVTTQIRPETVHFKDLSTGQPIRVLEQNYRYDILAPTSLIQRYVGRTVTLVHVVPGTGEVRRREATLLSIGDVTGATYGGGYGIGAAADSNPWEYVYDFGGGEISFGGDWRIVVPPEIPAGFVARPTLFWELEAPAAGRRRVEASYLTHGMNWSADYVLVLAGDGAKGDLTGWVTLTNDSGITFDDAQLKLVAGDVNIVPPAGSNFPLRAARSIVMAEQAAPSTPAFAEEGMFEYHLYTLQRPTDLRDREQKQIELLSGSGIPIERHYRLYAQPYWFVSQVNGIQENLHPDVWLEFVNAETVGLGVPLPAGTVRVYVTEAGRAGGRQFLGEDSIRHTAREERVKVRTGRAFDIVIDRRQTDYEVIGSEAVATEWELKLRNRKTTPVVVEVREPTSGDWEIVSSSLPFVKESSREVRFDVTLPPGREVVLTYRIRVKYY